jgi:hypothetical protein
MDLRHEALLMLDKRGAVLETAREISRILKAHGLRGAVIGGVAVVLHGHIRTTKDVDVYAPDPDAVHDALVAAAFEFDDKLREFNRDGIPVQLVTQDLVDPLPGRSVKIEGVTTVSLVDLINIKLHSGLSTIARAQDIADVIGLIQHHRLSAAFAARIDRRFRADFKKLLKALRQ